MLQSLLQQGVSSRDRPLSWEPTIKARIARNARMDATHLKLRCAECAKKNIPDPENTQREDLICEDCFHLLKGDNVLDRRSRQMSGL